MPFRTIVSSLLFFVLGAVIFAVAERGFAQLVALDATVQTRNNGATDPADKSENASAHKVTGIGGVFFKAKNPDKLRTWYRDHLGLVSEGEAGVTFHWRESEKPEKAGRTIWSVFPVTTKYFDPGTASFMINYRVENLNSLLAQLKRAGIATTRANEEYEYGKFAWITDPEGNCIELWEPK